MNNNIYNQEEQIKYSKLLSSFFCSIAIVAFSILCLLNNLTLDFYTMVIILKIVLPASFCFWFIGFVIGKILDSFNKKAITQKIKEERVAYEMPSMFAATENIEDEFGGLLWKTKSNPLN